MVQLANAQQLKEISDTSWIRQSLFIPTVSDGSYRGNIVSNNSRTSSQRGAQSFSYQTLTIADTGLGGNKSMNPKPQFTEFADQNMRTLLCNTVDNGVPGPADSLGIGRYYAEAYDANASRIYMQFGLPAYNSLFNFLTTFYDTSHADLANSGKVGGGIFGFIGAYIGLVLNITLIPELAIFNFLYKTSIKAVADLQNRPLSKFYYCKPAMALYWSEVSTILNAIAVNMQLTSSLLESQINRDNKDGPAISISSEEQNDINIMNGILPGIFMSNNCLDIRMAANRYQRKADAHKRIISNIRNNKGLVTDEQVYNELQGYFREGLGAKGEIKAPMTMSEYLGGYLKSAAGTLSYLIDALIDETANTEGDKAPDKVSEESSKEKTNELGFFSGLNKHLSEYADFMSAEASDGSNFVSFIVDWENHVSESFSNSTKESGIAATMNQTSRGARDKWFNVANGNVAGGNFVADMVGKVASAVTDLTKSALDMVGFSG